MTNGRWDGYEHQAPRAAGLMNPRADIRPCACGGDIVAIRDDDANVTASVWAHQQTVRHLAWRQDQEREE